MREGKLEEGRMGHIGGKSGGIRNFEDIFLVNFGGFWTVLWCSMIPFSAKCKRDSWLVEEILKS